jgi:hypothetical protein
VIREKDSTASRKMQRTPQNPRHYFGHNHDDEVWENSVQQASSTVNKQQNSPGVNRGSWAIFSAHSNLNSTQCPSKPRNCQCNASAPLRSHFKSHSLFATGTAKSRDQFLSKKSLAGNLVRIFFSKKRHFPAEW